MTATEEDLLSAWRWPRRRGRRRRAGMTWRDVRLCYVHGYSEPELDTERVVLLYLLQKP